MKAGNLNVTSCIGYVWAVRVKCDVEWPGRLLFDGLMPVMFPSRARAREYLWFHPERDRLEAVKLEYRAWP